MTLSYWPLVHGISSSDDELEGPLSRPTLVLNHNLYWSGIFPLSPSVKSSPEKYSIFYKREIDQKWQRVENSYFFSHYWSYHPLELHLNTKTFFLKTPYFLVVLLLLFSTLLFLSFGTDPSLPISARHAVANVREFLWCLRQECLNHWNILHTVPNQV